MAYTEIDKPSDYFETLTWSGNSTDDRAISGLDFAPNWVWIKCRNNGQNHNIFDTVRGATESLESNNNNAENTDSTSLKSFTSDGYTLGTGSTVNSSSPSTKTYVGWNWKESATAGFDIVTYTGNQTARTISHNLGAVPKMMIVKNRGTTGNWGIYHVGLGTANKRLELDSNAAADTGTSVWNDTDPTSSVFSVGNNDRITNGNGMTYVAYLFAEKKGYSKFGSYVGNGNVSGSYIHLGFKPAFVLLKHSSGGTDNWNLYDNKRLGYNANYSFLIPNESNAENTGATTAPLDLLSNGFKIRASTGHSNSSGETYIYMAFAENPFVTGASAIPTTAR